MKKSSNFIKIFSAMLCFVIILSSVNVSKVEAYNYGIIKQNTYGVVTKVLDGESIEVKDSNGTYYLVKMIGVDAKAYDDSYQYTYNRLMGKNILLTLDTTVPSPVGRWNYCYVRDNNEVLNTKIIAIGYGEANPSTATNTIYTQYSYIEDSAKTQNIGMWGNESVDGTTFGGYEYTDDTININTATQSQIAYKLDDVSEALASEIVAHRRYNPYNKVSDIKFVKGMTKAIYDKNVDKMHVVTNLNKAKAYEISTLIKVSSEQADDIVAYVDKKNKVTFVNLLDDEILTDAQYEANKEFISVTDAETISYSIGSNGANINLANATALNNAGLTTSDADAIINLRDKGFTFKTLGELQKSSKINITDEGTRRLLDNLNVVTDINTASVSELKSMFPGGYGTMNQDINELIDGRKYQDISKVDGIIPHEKYQKIKPFIYVNSFKTNYINLNTATLEQLVRAGIDTNTARLIITKQKSSLMSDFTEVPNYDKLTSFDNSISLFTNVNNTSTLELTSLSPNMGNTFAQSIIDYANKQPFGSYEELQLFFEQNNKLPLYNEIKDFVVFY